MSNGKNDGPDAKATRNSLLRYFRMISPERSRLLLLACEAIADVHSQRVALCRVSKFAAFFAVARDKPTSADKRPVIAARSLKQHARFRAIRGSAALRGSTDFDELPSGLSLRVEDSRIELAEVTWRGAGFRSVAGGVLVYSLAKDAAGPNHETVVRTASYDGQQNFQGASGRIPHDLRAKRRSASLKTDT